MRLRFAYNLGNGSETVTAGPMAIVGYEIENRTKVSRLAADGIGLVDMTDLAYRQLVLEGRYTGTLDEFRTALVDIDPVEVDDPTLPVGGA